MRDVLSQRTSQPDPAWRWIGEHFQVIDAETGKPSRFIVFPWMARILLDILPAGEELPYGLVLYSTIKKSGKTAFNAAVAAELMFNRAPAGAELYNFANSKEQSTGRVFRAVKYAVEHDQALASQCRATLETVIRLRNGTFLQALAAMHANIAGANPYYSGWCVDQDTEALTRHGFKLVVDLNIDDEVATLNPGTGKLEWHRPRAVNVSPYRGPMVRFQHRRADFLVTPNHRVLGRFVTHSRYKRQAEERGWWFEEATDAARFAQGWLKADADWDGVPGHDPALAALLGFYIADGHSPSVGTVHITKSQVDSPAVYEAIRRIVAGLQLDYTGYPGGIRIRSRELAGLLRPLGKSAEKYVPQELKDADTGVLAAFFEAYMMCDGWRPTAQSTGWQCGTTSRRLVDDLMEIGLKLGYQPRWMQTRQRGGGDPIHRLSFSRGPVAWQRSYGDDERHWSEVEYDGLIACPSVLHGIFYIRRNGKCCWTGNTELWGYEHEKELRAWTEMTPPPTIRNSMRLVDTYAGYEGESGLLNSLEDQAKAGRQLHPDGFELPADYRAYAAEVIERDPAMAPHLLPAKDRGRGPVAFDDPLPVYVDDDSRLYAYWDEGVGARRLPWQQGERGRRYYVAEQRSMTDPQYQRLHLNRRAKRGGQFVSIETWDVLPRCDAWQAGDTDAVVLAVDAGTHDDHMSLVGVRVRDQTPQECYTADWAPAANEAAAGKAVIDPADARAEILRLRAAGMQVLAVAYDPYQFHSIALQLARDGFRIVEITQGQPRLESDTFLWNLIRDGRLAHSHNPVMRAAVENANALGEKGKTGDERRVRIVKGSGKVDPLVALSMATWVVLNPPTEKPGAGIAVTGVSLLGGLSDRPKGPSRLPGRGQSGGVARFQRVKHR